MTIKDIKELSYPELEELMAGIGKNAEREKEMLEGVSKTKGDAEDFVSFMTSGGGRDFNLGA